MSLVKCLICNREIHIAGISSHLKKHNLKVSEYYDKYLKKSNEEGFCKVCGVDLNKLSKNTKIHLHHIDFNKLNDDRQNLVFLCNSCHAKTTWNRTHLKTLLEKFNYELMNKSNN